MGRWKLVYTSTKMIQYGMRIEQNVWFRSQYSSCCRSNHAWSIQNLVVIWNLCYYGMNNSIFPSLWAWVCGVHVHLFEHYILALELCTIDNWSVRKLGTIQSWIKTTMDSNRSTGDAGCQTINWWGLYKNRVVHYLWDVVVVYADRKSVV